VTYKEIDEMIKTVDKNGDGKINYSEEIDEMIKTVDKNGDGKINYSEFRVSSFLGFHSVGISLRGIVGN